MKTRYKLTERDMHRIVRKVLKENLVCKEPFIQDMYEKLRKLERIDCDIKGYDKFKEAFSKALDILEDVLHGTGRHRRERD